MAEFTEKRHFFLKVTSTAISKSKLTKNLATENPSIDGSTVASIDQPRKLRTLDPWTSESQGLVFFSGKKKHIYKNSGLTIALSLSSLQEKTLGLLQEKKHLVYKNCWWSYINPGDPLRSPPGWCFWGIKSRLELGYLHSLDFFQYWCSGWHIGYIILLFVLFFWVAHGHLH